MEVRDDAFFQEITFNNLHELFNWFIDISLRGLLKDFVYRGVANSKWTLIPSALRERIKNNCSTKWKVLEEIKLLKNFYNNADSCGLPLPQVNKWFKDVCLMDYYDRVIDFQRWPTNDILELMALAQHNGVKTRLLDWSKNFFVALYFAAQDCDDKSEYCSVWAANQHNISSVFSMAYSIDKCEIKFCKPCSYQNDRLKVQQGLLSYVEIPIDAKNEITNEEFDKLLLSYAKTYNRKELNLNNVKMLYKLNIPSSSKNNLIEFLQSVGISKITLFPDYKTCSENS